MERRIPLPAAGTDEVFNTHQYPRNEITTSKYTVLNFVPRNIWEQFHKAANNYFLLIGILMFIGNYTPLFHGFIACWGTLLPLAVMLIASAIFAALDDRRRHRADARTNSQVCHRLRGAAEEVRWDEVVVGDILIVEDEGEFPADLVMLASSSVNTCYVDTANLDGESNLKLKESPKCIPLAYAEDQPLLNQAVAKVLALNGVVVVEGPQRSIHSFKGSMEMEEPEALGAQHLLLRGTILKNTSWVLGLVVYTGPESRMVMNSREAKPKYPNIEKAINRSLLVIVGAQCLMALISDILYLVNKKHFLKLWYLFPSGEVERILLPDWMGYYLTFFVLYSNLMPISLYFTMEVCNAAQAYFVNNDLKMYDEAQDTAASARTTNLCHELGQVKYIFSDKTGTLTQNVMELKKLSIAGQIFDEESWAALDSTADGVLEVLAVSHTVVCTKDRNGKLKYEAESPDEGALVEAVAKLGWSFRGRSKDGLTVQVGTRGSRMYDVLALNAFTSARKRQSVLVRRASGEVVLLVKGADDVMQKLAVDATFPQEHLRSFAKEGLRTLVLGRRFISEGELQQWHSEYQRAQNSMQDREGALTRVADEIERSLEILGITGIEDKLQVGVEDAIVKIRQAGIKLWVLTGDKMETARNIGFSTKVLSSSMKILVLDGDEDLQLLRKRALQASEKGVTVALIVTGHALEDVLNGEDSETEESEGEGDDSSPMGKLKGPEKIFLEVAVLCSVVIACRVSPLQKAELVRLVRKGVSPTPVTLAIGDGANDVPMLQEAQVGVGISGREGRQAVNSADFAIAQFRYLVRLLLVHGHWNYRRVCKFVIYTFWRQTVLVLLTYYYTFVSGFAGQNLFEDTLRPCYNIVLAAPIIATGVFDQDVTEQEAMADPRHYITGREGLDFNAKKLVEMLLSAVVHSSVIGFVMLMVVDGMSILHTGDLYTYGTIAFTVLVVSMNYRAAFVTRTWNVMTLAAQASSFVTYALWLLMYNIPWIAQRIQPWMLGVPTRMACSPYMWICVIAVPALAMVIDIFKAHLLNELFPDRAKLRNAESEMDEESGSFARMLTPSNRRSSYAFAHPDGPQRNLRDFVNRPATASDLSFINSSRTGSLLTVGTHPTLKTYATVGSGSPPTTGTYPTLGMYPTLLEVSDASEASSDVEVRPNEPDRSSFAQQKMPSIQVEWTARKVVSAACCIGIFLVCLGCIIIVVGRQAVEVSTSYSLQRHSSIPFRETKAHAASCETMSCTLPLLVPEDMPPPVLLMIRLDPFYQNYPTYVKSGGRHGAWPQLSGVLSRGQLSKSCPVESTRVGAEGLYFPCGLQAGSFFNDTFRLRRATQELAISMDHVALDVDLDRMRNPEGYPNEAGIEWLYMRYPEVISEEEGVRNERFVEWMRPAALSSVFKRIGELREGLSKGETIFVDIGIRFPAAPIDVEKEFVLISPSLLGGSARTFGSLLCWAGAVCLGLALAALLHETFKGPGVDSASDSEM